MNQTPWARVDSFDGNSVSEAATMFRACPVCGSARYRTAVLFDSFQFFSDSARQSKRAPVRDVQCQDCFAVYMNPCYAPAGFSVLFAEAGQSYGSTEGRPKEQLEWLGQRGLLESDKVFLDVGCYEGKFLSQLPRGLRRLGVDIDAPAIARGNERYAEAGIQLIHGPLERFAVPQAPDVITMFHVLEHVADPYEVLCNLRRVAHELTCLVVEVPVLEDGTTNDINGFLSVQHMTHFSRASLEKLTARAGWNIVERQQMPDYNGFRILMRPGAELRDEPGSVDDRAALSRYLSNWYAVAAEVAERIGGWTPSDRVVIWGAGMHTEFLYQVTPFFQVLPERKYLLVDSDPLKHGKTWRGIPILEPAMLRSLVTEKFRLVVSSYGAQERIVEAAQTYGVPLQNIDRIYDDIRVY